MPEKQETIEALKCIPVPEDRNEWLKIAMACKAADLSEDDFISWSSQGVKYDPKVDREQYRSLKKEGGVTEKTLFYIAGQHGYKNADHHSRQDRQSDYDPERKLKRDLIQFLSAVFYPEEHVAYCTDCWMDEKKNKWKPRNRIPFRTAGQLIEALEQPGSSIDRVFGKYNHDAGAWCNVNPVNGNSGKKEDVTAYRHILVENDENSLEEQERILRELQLPITALTYSGDRSLHALVRVDAKTEAEYKSRFDYLRSVLADHHYSMDNGNSDVSRQTRLPSFQRGDRWQRLKAVNIGMSSWDEWIQWYESLEADGLPDVEPFSKYLTEPLPERAEPLIEGILRRGQKLMITGASKMGKSHLMVSLAISVAEGIPWIGFTVRPGRVLYINLEISEPSFLHRIEDNYEALGIQKQYRHYEKLHIWNLRGKAMPLDKLIPAIKRRIVRNHGYDLVILDPIYKVITGSENDASDMGRFCNLFDRICEMGCSTAVVHHHSKGAQGMKNAMDRGSGSGVFARDADALIDFSKLVLLDSNNEIVIDEKDPSAEAYRAEFTLREFRRPDPVNVWFEFPLFRVDDETLGDLPLVGSSEGNRTLSPNNQKHAQRKGKLDYGFNSSRKENGLAKVYEVASYAGVSERTIRDWVKEENSGYYLQRGMIGRKE